MTNRDVRRSSQVLVAEVVASVGEGNKFTKLNPNKDNPLHTERPTDR